MPQRIGFVTCVELGFACVQEIYELGGALDLVITLNDHRSRNKSGRVFMDEFCARHGAPLLKIGNINDATAVQAVRDYGLDWVLVVGWSQIARRPFLDSSGAGSLGMHPTLLPTGRGRAPIPWAILKGLTETGVSLFKLDEGVDTGPVAVQERLAIGHDETATTLYARVADAHRRLIARAWQQLVEGTLAFTAQDERLATVWPGRRDEDGEIRESMPCAAAGRLVRATTRPYPGAFLSRPQGRYRVWSGQTHAGRQVLEETRTDAAGHLWFPLRDGCFEATEWQIQAIDSSLDVAGAGRAAH